MQRTVFVFLVCLLASVFAVSQDYAGDTSSGATWNAPTYDDNGNCAATSPARLVKYQAINVTVAQPTYLSFSAFFESRFSGAQILMYNATLFNPADPCVGFLAGFLPDTTVPPISLVGTVEDSFVMVVTSTEETGQGLFSISAAFPDIVLSNTNASLTYYPINDDSAVDCSTTSSTPVQYASFVATPQVSGYYEVLVLAAGATDILPVLAVFQGAFPADPSPSTPCAGANYYGAVIAFFPNTLGTNLPLEAGQSYTFVLSGSAPSQVGEFAVFLKRSGIYFTSDTADYNLPALAVSEISNNCSLTGTMSRSVVIPFVATEQVYLLDTGNSFFDAAVFVYKGSFTAPPTNCSDFVVAADSGSNAIGFRTEIGQAYTVVVGALEADTGGLVFVYLTTGEPVGLPPTTTGVATTGAATTGVMTTTGAAGSTTGISITSATSTTSDEQSSSSSASSLVASFFLAMMAAALAL